MNMNKNLKLLIIISYFLVIIYKNPFWLDKIYIKIIKNKIKIAILSNSIKNGGLERQTSLMLHYFNKINIFDLYLFTLMDKQENEYKIDVNIKRITIKNNLSEILNENDIDILIYQFYKVKEIEQLNNMIKTKTIFINRSCFLHWIYYKIYNYFKILYRAYRNCKYLISLVPFENNYLFKKWGINSILMNNFIAYEYNSIKPSDLSSQIILMIGRGSDPIKRFELGISAMKHIISEIPKCEMKI